MSKCQCVCVCVCVYKTLTLFCKKTNELYVITTYVLLKIGHLELKTKQITALFTKWHVHLLICSKNNLSNVTFFLYSTFHIISVHSEQHNGEKNIISAWIIKAVIISDFCLLKMIQNRIISQSFWIKYTFCWMFCCWILNVTRRIVILHITVFLW